VATPIAVIGIPAGLEVRHDQLKEHVMANRISAYEVKDSEIVLYWRGIEANQKLEVAIELLAAVPGTYNGPASRVYPYYTDENKYWVAGADVVVLGR